MAPKLAIDWRDADALLSLLAHDLRSPLGPLALAASAIADDESVPESARELARFAQAQCARAARLIQSTLWAAHGYSCARDDHIDLTTTIERAIEDAAALGIACESTAPRGLRLRGDPVAFRDAVCGLLDAAAATTATIRVSVIGATAEMLIAGDALDRVPDDGWRALHVCAAGAVVRAHGGDVVVREDGVLLALDVVR